MNVDDLIKDALAAQAAMLTEDDLRTTEPPHRQPGFSNRRARFLAPMLAAAAVIAIAAGTAAVVSTSRADHSSPVGTAPVPSTATSTRVSPSIPTTPAPTSAPRTDESAHSSPPLASIRPVTRGDLASATIANCEGCVLANGAYTRLGPDGSIRGGIDLKTKAAVLNDLNADGITDGAIWLAVSTGSAGQDHEVVLGFIATASGPRQLADPLAYGDPCRTLIISISEVPGPSRIDADFGVWIESQIVDPSLASGCAGEAGVAVQESGFVAQFRNGFVQRQNGDPIPDCSATRWSADTSAIVNVSTGQLRLAPHTDAPVTVTFAASDRLVFHSIAPVDGWFYAQVGPGACGWIKDPQSS